MEETQGIPVPRDGITFYTPGFDGRENPSLIELRANGDIFIRGVLTTNDMEVVDGFRTFLKSAGVIA